MVSKQIGLRVDTYNTPIIVGLGKACEIINKQFDEKVYSLSTSKDTIIEYCENIKILEI
jgi:cysteine desulfurase